MASLMILKIIYTSQAIKRIADDKIMSSIFFTVVLSTLENKYTN